MLAIAAAASTFCVRTSPPDWRSPGKLKLLATVDMSLPFSLLL